MKEFYIEPLSTKYSGDDNSKTPLAGDSVLHIVMDKRTEHVNSESNKILVELDFPEKPGPAGYEPNTFHNMEERWHNFQHLIDKENV